LLYARYFDRFGSERLTWADIPENTSEGTYVVYDYDSRYTQHDLQVAIEFRPAWHDIYFSGGTEITHYRLHQQWTWYRYINGELFDVYPEHSRQRHTASSRFVGVGWECMLGQRSVIRIQLTHSFSYKTAGTRIAVGFRFKL
jgi:hypothetical protein